MIHIPLYGVIMCVFRSFFCWPSARVFLYLPDRFNILIMDRTGLCLILSVLDLFSSNLSFNLVSCSLTGVFGNQCWKRGSLQHFSAKFVNNLSLLSFSVVYSSWLGTYTYRNYTSTLKGCPFYNDRILSYIA